MLIVTVLKCVFEDDRKWQFSVQERNEKGGRFRLSGTGGDDIIICNCKNRKIIHI